MKGNTEDERDTTEQPTSKKRRLADILKKQTTESSSAATEDRVSSEVEKYLHAPNQDTTTDPLQWWKVHAQEYPHLARLTRRYLCICATSSPSERLFSTAGNVVSKKAIS